MIVPNENETDTKIRLVVETLTSLKKEMILVWVQKKENCHRLERELHFLSKAEFFDDIDKLCEEGLITPEPIENQHADQDYTLQLLEECFVNDPVAWTSNADFQKIHIDWCKENNVTPKAMNSMSIILKRKGYTPGVIKRMMGTKRGILGLRVPNVDGALENNISNSTVISDTEKHCLDILGDDVLRSNEWGEKCIKEIGISSATFERCKKKLNEKGYVQKSRIEGKIVDVYRAIISEAELKEKILETKYKEENIGLLETNIAALQDAIDDLSLIKSF
jgi:hypothetical protein